MAQIVMSAWPYCAGRHLFTIATKESMTGTSTKTPTTVAKAAPELSPNKEIATATASSKKLDVPIKHAGPATLCGNFNRLAAHQLMKKMP
jgi:hypothetical protein